MGNWNTSENIVVRTNDVITRESIRQAMVENGLTSMWGVVKKVNTNEHVVTCRISSGSDLPRKTLEIHGADVHWGLSKGEKIPITYAPDQINQLFEDDAKVEELLKAIIDEYAENNGDGVLLAILCGFFGGFYSRSAEAYRAKKFQTCKTVAKLSIPGRTSLSDLKAAIGEYDRYGTIIASNDADETILLRAYVRLRDWPSIMLLKILENGNKILIHLYAKEKAFHTSEETLKIIAREVCNIEPETLKLNTSEPDMS